MAPEKKAKGVARKMVKETVHHTECRNTLEVSIAWVIPVKVEQLGAHLQAYQEVLPVRIAFRLCVLKGESSISKLPIEVVDEIMEHVMQSRREELSIEWTDRYLCSASESDVRVLDHIKKRILNNGSDDVGGLCEYLVDWSRWHCDSCSAGLYLGPPEADVSYCESCLALFDLDNPTGMRDHEQAADLAYMLGDFEPWMTATSEAARDWHDETKDGLLFHVMLGQLLANHFGLCYWLGFQEADDDVPLWYHTTVLLYAKDTKTAVSDSGLIRACTKYTHMPVTSTTRCMKITKIQQPAAHQVHALHRAMHKLKLTPCTEIVREDCPHLDHGSNLAEWPQLVSLSRVEHSLDSVVACKARVEEEDVAM